MGGEQQHCEVWGPSWAPPQPSGLLRCQHLTRALHPLRPRTMREGLVQCCLLSPSEGGTGFRSSQAELRRGVQGAEGAWSPAGDGQLSQSLALGTPSVTGHGCQQDPAPKSRLQSETPRKGVAPVAQAQAWSSSMVRRPQERVGFGGAELAGQKGVCRKRGARPSCWDASEVQGWLAAEVREVIVAGGGELRGKEAVSGGSQA